MACAYASDEGWDIVGVFKDVGVPDNPWNRPAFRQVMDIMRAAQANVLVVSHLDRIARDRRTIDAICDELSLLGGCLIAASSGFGYRPLQ